MAMNLDALLRITAKVGGVGDVNALERSLTGVEKAAGEASKAFKGVTGLKTWQAAAAGAAVFGAAIGISAKAAIDFESSMADVRKVVSGLETPKAFGEIKQEILGLSRELPVAVDGIAAIYAAAGQSGIGRAELKEFATLVAQVGVAFDMTAEQAGTALAQMKVALGLTTPGLRELADSMNALSNNSGATASNLVEFMTRAGAVGKLAGLTGQQTAAFGAAMIQTGINTETAATSFNNLIKALSKGPSMTERQVSALARLGYSMANAKQIEQELTRVAETESRRRVDAAKQLGNETVRVAEEQSRQRIEIARDETNQLNREINRRYRNQLQALQDSWDDEANAREEALQDRVDEQIKGLQRQQDAEIRAAQERARANNADASAQVDIIRDGYERRIDAIRDGLQRQLTVERRAARDQQQVTRDQLQDQQDAETKGVNSRLDAIQRGEQQRLEVVRDGVKNRIATVEEEEKLVLEKSRAAAKKTGEELAAASAQGFADRLQDDAIDTITEVLGKIANLPKAQQLSVLSDLFGDEARGLAPLLANLGELERLLGIAGNKAGYTGSVMEEFRVRSETAANKLQLFNNNLTALQIVVGEKVLPALVKLVEIFGPVLEGFAKFAEANPEITAVAVAIGSVISALVLLAPFITSAITLFSGLLAWMGTTFIPVLLGFFSGPVGWTVLAIAAVVAMAYAFREPIGKFLTWFGEAFMKGLTTVAGFLKRLWVDPWIGLWNNLLRKPVTDLWNWFSTGTQDNMRKAADLVRGIWTGLIGQLKQLVNGFFKGWGDRINFVIDGVNNLIAGFNRLGLAQIPFVNRVPIPQFAEGGVITRPTVGLVGEAGPEYIIPARKMATASQNFLAGARGDAVLNGSRTAGSAAPVINITTGPVIEANGQRYVSITDLEMAMRTTADAVLGQLRTPSARMALGIT